MCKMKYNKEILVHYLKKLIGVEVHLLKTLNEDLIRLPILIKDCYYFVDVNIFDIRLTIAYPKFLEDITPMQLAKHQNKMREVFGRSVVYAIEKIESYNISRLTRANVNFIMPNKMVFIPDIMLVLHEKKNTINKISENMPPVAQLIVLYNLQVEDLNGKTILDISECVQMAYPTVNIALKWLVNKNIIEFKGTKQKNVFFLTKGKMLWEKCLPLMTSPIKRVIYTDTKFDGCIFSGETAMGDYTMLAEPVTPTLAVSVKLAKENVMVCNKDFGDYRVEVWKYNPSLLTKNNTVDKLSLYLSLRNNEDERVQIELDNMINEMIW